MAFHLRFRCPSRELPLRDGQLYCASCDHTVTDLAGMSREEADAWLRAAPDGACVRVRRDRAGNRVHPVVVAAAAALALTTPALADDLPCPQDGMSDIIDFGGIGNSDGPVGPHDATAELSAHVRGWIDDGAVRDQVLQHPGPFRHLLEPLAGDLTVATVLLLVRPDGTVADVRTPPDLPSPADRHVRRLSRLTFPASPHGGRVVVHYGPPNLHLSSGPPDAWWRCRSDEEP